MILKSSEKPDPAVGRKYEGMVWPIKTITQIVLSFLKNINSSLWKLGLYPDLVCKDKFNRVSIIFLHSSWLKEC